MDDLKFGDLLERNPDAPGKTTIRRIIAICPSSKPWWHGIDPYTFKTYIFIPRYYRKVEGAVK
jgi:hypothetical protein